MIIFALKSLLSRKLRMLLTTFAIVLGVSFVSGTYIFTDSIGKTFDGLFDNVFSSIDLTLRPSSTNENGVSEEYITKLQQIPEVRVIAPQNYGNAQIISKEGEPIGGNGPPTLGFSWVKEPSLNVLKIKEGNGRAPTASGEVAIDANTAKNNNFELGQDIQIITVGVVETFKLVGIVSFGDLDTLAGATISVFDIGESRRLFDITAGYFSEISLKAKEGVTPEALKSRVEQIVPSDVELLTGEAQKNEQIDEVNQGLGFVNTALLSFAFISIFVGSFIIFLTFWIIITQRTKELALLRLLGATKQQVLLLVTTEAIIVSAFASGIGLLLGILISNGLRAAGNAAGFGLPEGQLTIEPRTIIVSFAVGMIATLLATFFPALKASRVSPIEAMREEEAARPEKSKRRTAVFGLIVSVLGGSLMAYGLFASVKSPVIPVGAGMLILFIGTTILSPRIIVPVSYLVGYFVKLRYKTMGRLATDNIRRTPLRASFAAAALMIGVSLVVFSTIFTSSIKATVDETINGQFPADITIRTKNQGDPLEAKFTPKIADDLRQLEEVAVVNQLKYDKAELDGKEKLIIAVRPDTINDSISLKPINGNYDELGINEVYIYEKTLEEIGKKVGDTIQVGYELTGSSELKITGIFEEPFDSPYLISLETHSQNFSDDRDILVAINLKDNVTVEEGKTAINKVLESYPVAKAQDKGELIEEAKTQTDQALVMLTLLLGFAILIAMLGITNTLTLSVTERTREIGLLRAIGMTRTQVRSMIRAEAIIIALFGAMLGVVLGTFFGWAILKALEDLGFSSFSIPFGRIAAYLVVAAFAGVIAAILPSFKASRMNILDAINYE